MMGRMVCTTSKWSAFVRDTKFRLARALGKLPDGPPAYPPISDGAILVGSNAAGTYFPQALSADGQRLDDVFGIGQWLISRDDLAAQKLAPFAASLGQWLDKAQAEAVLIRADRYVFGTGTRDSLRAAWRVETGMDSNQRTLV